MRNEVSHVSSTGTGGVVAAGRGNCAYVFLANQRVVLLPQKHVLGVSELDTACLKARQVPVYECSDEGLFLLGRDLGAAQTCRTMG